jgi:hypothetical protein
MVFFWGKTTAAAFSVNVERLREAERVLVELALRQQQQQQTTAPSITSKESTQSFPPLSIQTLDTIIPKASVHQSHVVNPCRVGMSPKSLECGQEDTYTIHGISITSQHNVQGKHVQCDKPLVLLHGYSTLNTIPY